MIYSAYIICISPNTNKKGKERLSMEKTDTIKLLQECDAGSKMAVTSIDELLDKATDLNLQAFWWKAKSIMRN